MRQRVDKSFPNSYDTAMGETSASLGRLALLSARPTLKFSGCKCFFKRTSGRKQKKDKKKNPTSLASYKCILCVRLFLFCFVLFYNRCIKVRIEAIKTRPEKKPLSRNKEPRLQMMQTIALCVYLLSFQSTGGPACHLSSPERHKKKLLSKIWTDSGMRPDSGSMVFTLERVAP